MLLSFDVVPDAVEEHDRWHTHEHLPERLSIPGFRRGTRWVAMEGEPRYMVLYEVDNLDVLTSGAYLERLNNPSPWTTRMMPNYRGMTRGLCSVAGSFGFGQGQAAAVIRLTSSEAHAPRLNQWLLQELLPGLPELAGLGSAHLLHGAAVASMTSEQRIRGVDKGVDSAIIVTGYDADAVAACARKLVGPDYLPAHGGADLALAIYNFSYSLVSGDIGT